MAAANVRRHGMREPGILCSPWRNDRLHPVLRTPAARKTSDDLGYKLHGVEIPPPSLFGVLGQPTGSSAFRTGNATINMSKPNPDPPLIDLKVHVLHLPGFIDSQEAGIMRREYVHGHTLRHPPLTSDAPMPRKSPKNQEGRRQQGCCENGQAAQAAAQVGARRGRPPLRRRAGKRIINTAPPVSGCRPPCSGREPFPRQARPPVNPRSRE